jgi:chemotaxis protein methyltransferase CheR
MLLDRLIPDIAEWNITILATDINPRFLEIASLGIFGEWSFRAIPDGIRERYFSPVHGGKMQIVKHIGDMVTFAVLNLAEDSYPSLVNNTNAMDLVLCRNVLMYFTPENAARVIRGFHHVLAVDGWLLAAPSESSPALFREFTMVGFPDVIFFRNSLPAAIAPVEIQEHRAPREELPRANDPPTSPPPVVSPGLAARELANGGRLADAHAVCDHAISLDPLNPLYRFLRALVEQEQGQLDAAVKSLQQSLYLDKDFVMAHFALGNLGKRLGRHALSRRHFRGAMSLLATMEPESPLPESDGLSAGRLAEVIRFATAGEGDHS